MKITFDIPEAVIRFVVSHIMNNFPEASSPSLRCTSWKYDKLAFTFLDCEEGKQHTVKESHLVDAFALMFTDKWLKGLTQLPSDVTNLESWENWLGDADANDFDAFVQLAIFKEVIYG